VARDFARRWLPALAWTAVVLWASTDTFSAENTGSVLDAAIRFLVGALPPHTLATLNFLLRKSAHLTEYGILGLLWFRTWRGSRQGHEWKWALAGIGIALLTAIMDEVHQSFVPSRTGSAWDVLLDLTGAVAAQILLWGVMRWKAMRGEVCQPERVQL
jgi:VanZ family protein